MALRGLTPLHRAIEAHKPLVVKRLIALKADVNQKDLRGMHPVTMACGPKGSQEMVELLFEFDASLDESTVYSYLTLHTITPRAGKDNFSLISARLRRTDFKKVLIFSRREEVFFII